MYNRVRRFIFFFFLDDYFSFTCCCCSPSSSSGYFESQKLRHFLWSVPECVRGKFCSFYRAVE